MSLDSKTNTLPLIPATVAATAAVTLLAVNFSVGETQITERITHTYTIADPQFQRSMGALLGPPLVDGNRVDTLVNGREIFPAMIAAIKGARKTVTFETYIYWSGRIGREFAAALADRARSGIRVHVLVDWVGSSRMDPNYLDTMKRAGVEIEKYHPPRWYTLHKLNNRTHRKLLVVDGLWTSVGSTDFDNRSFSLNDEANLNVYSRAFAERQIALFNNDLRRSRRITFEEWEQRPWMEKLQERIESLLDSQL